MEKSRLKAGQLDVSRTPHYSARACEGSGKPLWAEIRSRQCSGKVVTALWEVEYCQRGILFKERNKLGDAVQLLRVIVIVEAKHHLPTCFPNHPIARCD